MIRPHTLPKRPEERIPASILLASEMDATEEISAVAVVYCIDVATGFDSTLDILDGVPLFEAQTISQWVYNGVKGERHELRLEATTSLGQVITPTIYVVIT